MMPAPGGLGRDPAPVDELDAQVHDALAGLNPLARDIAARYGQTVSDRMAAQGQRRRDMVEASHEISEAMQPMTVGPGFGEMQRRRYGDEQGRDDGGLTPS